MEETILIIEDDAGIRDSLIDMLELNGFCVIGSENGKQGLEILGSQQISLILSDIMMPEMDGYSLLKHIRQNPNTEFIPIIMLTAKAELESKLQGLELGANDYLTKPFEYRELELKMRNLLSTRQKLISVLYTTPNQIKVESEKGVLLKKLLFIVDEYLEEQNLQVNDLAGHLNMSASTLQRHIKELTGYAPSRFVKEYRLKRAKEMIEIGYGSLSEISSKTGFKSLSYFSSSYKDFFGNPPSEDFGTKNRITVR